MSDKEGKGLDTTKAPESIEAPDKDVLSIMKDFLHKVLIENKIQVQKVVYDKDSPKKGSKKIRDKLVLSYSGRLNDRELQVLKHLFRAVDIEIGSGKIIVDCPKDYQKEVSSDE